MNRLRKPAMMHALLSMAAAWGFTLGVTVPAQAQTWSEYAMVSTTMGVSDGRVCVGEGSRGDIGCPSYAPFVSSTSGYVGIGTSAPAGVLDVSGTSGRMYLSSGGDRLTFTRNGSNYIQATGASSNLGFIAGGNILHMNIRSNGHIIISNSLSIGDGGTIAPSATLDVSGTLKIANGGESCNTNRLGALKYASNQFYICQNTTNGWESLATTSSNTTVAINTGLSGSIVFRDETGALKARDSFSISSTTGSVGIGAGAPTSLGNNGLYASGIIQSGNAIYGTSLNLSGSGQSLNWPGNTEKISADSNNSYLRIFTSGTEALRIVSTGYVGIGTASPAARLDVSGTVSVTLIKLANAPADACTIATIGAIKSINGRIYVCRQ